MTFNSDNVNPINNLHGDLKGSSESLELLCRDMQDMTEVFAKNRLNTRDYADTISYKAARDEWNTLEANFHKLMNDAQSLTMKYVRAKWDAEEGE